MKKLLLLFCMLAVINLNGQTRTKPIKAMAGDTVTNHLDKSLQYAFGEFTDGTVTYKQGPAGKGTLNYNYLIGEMQFVDHSTDKILSLAEPEAVRMVTIDGRQFIPAGEASDFMELLTKGDIRLAVKHRNKALSTGKTGAYGTVNTSSGMTTYTSMNDDVARDTQFATHTLVLDDNIAISVNTVYYLIDGKGGKRPIKGVGTFKKVYPRSKASKIEKYVYDNRINFKSEEDLIKLTEYSNSL